MFDVSGTMIAVTWLFVYGLKKRLDTLALASLESNLYDGFPGDLAAEV